MKKILLVFTGGTIGSRIHNFTIDVEDGVGYYLLKLFREKYSFEVEFDSIQPINIASENAVPEHWEVLYSALNQIDMKQYSGVIITHGSDTLSYSAAALSFLFHHTQVPIIITGSNYPLEDVRSNGLINFACCVEFIMNSPLPGVFSLYQNDKGENLVYLASRMIEADAYNDQFTSFGGDEFGVITEGKLALKKSRINPSLHDIREPRRKVLEEKITFQNKIFAIRPYPGLDYLNFEFKNKPKAILHSLYHSATGCISDSDYSLPGFVKKCKAEGIDFYLISFKNIDQDMYRSSRVILEQGAIALQNISFEAAYAKLNIAYNQLKLSPQEYIERELFFEYLP